MKGEHTVEQLVFIVDLNEVDEYNCVPISMDYTLNRGPGVRISTDRQPAVGEHVRIHSDSDDTLYYARVEEVISDRDLYVRIDWDSCLPVLNAAWSACG